MGAPGEPAPQLLLMADSTRWSKGGPERSMPFQYCAIQEPSAAWMVACAETGRAPSGHRANTSSKAKANLSVRAITLLLGRSPPPTPDDRPEAYGGC